MACVPSCVLPQSGVQGQKDCSWRRVTCKLRVDILVARASQGSDVFNARTPVTCELHTRASIGVETVRGLVLSSVEARHLLMPHVC